MRTKILRMCRGDGVAYVEVSVQKASRNSHIAVSAFSEKGIELPLEGYEISNGNSLEFQVVYATPLLETRQIVFEFEERSTDGEVLSKVVRRIGRTTLKWLSRLGYRIDYEKAAQIRDIDRYTYSRQLHVNPTVFLSAGAEKSELILKGAVDAPEDETDVSLSLIDGDGVEREDCIFFANKPRLTSGYGGERREFGFTVRIPDDGNTYCLVAKSSSGNKDGFLCLDRISRGRLLAQCDPHFYRLSSDEMYGRRSKHRNKITSRFGDSHFENGCLFSIVVPLYNTPVFFFREMVQSVLDQTYGNWELILVNASPENGDLAAEIEALSDDRIRVISLARNEGIACNTNAGIEAAKGDYVLFFDHDDVLDRSVLSKYAERVSADPETDVLYCDEDLLNEQGEYVSPRFKSDFNIDLLRCHNYITHFLGVRASLAKRLRLRSEYDGAQDYDLVLRLTELTDKFVHVPEVLYHWRSHSNSTAKNAGNKNYADEAGRNALSAHLDRCGLDADVELTHLACIYHVNYSLVDFPMVSIVIPNKDSVEVLSRCIDSVVDRTRYQNYEIVIVENNSVDEATFDYYDSVQEKYPKVKVVNWGSNFNYSKINNFGVGQCSGEYLVFLNNDTEVISETWLESMLSFCQRSDVGAVGAKLLYPDGTIQHAGVMMPRCQSAVEAAGPVHVFQHLDRDDDGYMWRASLAQDLTAVTAACMMMRRSVFLRLGGFCEDYAVAYNDTDLCLRVRQEGLLVVYDPDALLYHYESLSRGPDTSSSDLKNYSRFLAEQGLLRTRWSEYYAKGDPYHGAFSTMVF